MCKYTSHDQSRVNGFSLLEILIGLSLAIFIISTFVRLYLHYHRQLIHLHDEESLHADITEAINLLKTDVSRAGYIGCAKLTSEFRVIPYRQYNMTNENALITTSNKMTVRYQEFPSAMVTADMDDHYRILTNHDNDFKSGDILMISDCLHAEIFRASFVDHLSNGRLITSNEPLKYKYHKHAEVGRFVISSFYLGTISQDILADRVSLLHENVSGEVEVLIDRVAKLNFEKKRDDVYFSFTLDDNQHANVWSGTLRAGS